MNREFSLSGAKIACGSKTLSVGTKALLIGSHQFIWNPICVTLAYHWFFGLPSWRMLIAILVHSWGYCGEERIWGNVRRLPSERSALIAYRIIHRICRLCGRRHLIAERYASEMFYEVLAHNFYHCRAAGIPMSKLGWAKLAAPYWDPWFFIRFRAWLSGERKDFLLRATGPKFHTMREEAAFYYNQLADLLEKEGFDLRRLPDRKRNRDRCSVN